LRDYHKYILRLNRKIVYVGISNDLERRCKEHTRDKKFTSIQKVGNRTTLAAARKWEADRLATYRRNNGGKNPRYNNKLSG
jgi:GIY-YIG catalytic domain.